MGWNRIFRGMYIFVCMCIYIYKYTMHDVYNMYIYNSVIHSFIFLLDLFVYLFRIYIYSKDPADRIPKMIWSTDRIWISHAGGNQEIEYGI